MKKTIIGIGMGLAFGASASSIVANYWADPIKPKEIQFELAGEAEHKAYQVVLGLEEQIKKARRSHESAKKVLTNAHCQLIGAKLSEGIKLSEKSSEALLHGACDDLAKSELGEL